MGEHRLRPHFFASSPREWRVCPDHRTFRAFKSTEHFPFGGNAHATVLSLPLLCDKGAHPLQDRPFQGCSRHNAFMLGRAPYAELYARAESRTAVRLPKVVLLWFEVLLWRCWLACCPGPIGPQNARKHQPLNSLNRDFVRS